MKYYYATTIILLLIIAPQHILAEDGGDIPQNWAKTVYYNHTIHYPKTVEEIQHILQYHAKIRVLGSMHSFNNITKLPQEFNGVYISMSNMNQVIKCCRGERVTIQPGITFGELGEYLHERNFGFHNMASLPHITVGGAISTGTHGAGVFNGNLASHVMQVKLISADGKLRTYRIGQDPEFQHIPVSFGLAGIIVEIELDIVPDYDIQQCIYENLPFNTIKKSDYKTAFSSAYSFSIFTQWKNRKFTSIWAKYRLRKGRNGNEESIMIDCPDMNKIKPSSNKVHPLPGGDTSFVSGGIGKNYKEPGYVGLPHFLMEGVPSQGEELQSEYFVSSHMFDVVIEVLFHHFEENPKLYDLLYVSEMRFVAGDKLTLSPQHVLGSSIGFHFTWKKEFDQVVDALKGIENVLKPYNALPHMGKLFTMTGRELEGKYGQRNLRAFQSFVAPLDPLKKFVNPFLQNLILLPTDKRDL